MSHGRVTFFVGCVSRYASRHMWEVLRAGTALERVRWSRAASAAVVLSLALSVATFDMAGAADPLPPVLDPTAGNAVCYGAPEGQSFQDLGAEPNAVREVIDCLSATGLAKGTTATTFSPSGTVTRRQMALFIQRLADLLEGLKFDTVELAALPAYDNTVDFPDVVGEDSAFEVAIGQLNQAGIVHGFSDGSFRPGYPVTRRQMAAFVNQLRAFLVDEPLASSDDFFDDDSGDSGEDDLNALAAIGVFVGDGTGNVFPGHELTRRQMANILLRVVQFHFQNGEVRPPFAPTGALAFLPGTRPQEFGVITPDIYTSGFAAEPDEASLIVDEGSLTSVVHHANGERLLVYRHAPETLQTVGDPLVVPTVGWPRWGGHLAAPDGTHFVLLGRDNVDERTDYDTIEVRRYDADWNLVAHGNYSSDEAGVYEPFAFGSPSMALVDGQLVIHMSRLQFITGDGLRHQLNLTLIGDADDLAMRRHEGRPYAAHSFNQLVVATHDGEGLIFVDHADAYPRGIQSGVTSVAGAVEGAQSSTNLVLAFDGSLADDFYQWTGTSVTGLGALDDGAIIVGNSVRHSGDSTRAVDQTENRNLFVLTIDDSGLRRDLRWLTDFPAHGGNTTGDPRLVRLDDGRYVVLFTIYDADGGTSLGYWLLDSSGRQVASATWPDAYVGAVSEIVVDGSNLFWIGSDGQQNRPMFVFRLDISEPGSPVLQ